MRTRKTKPIRLLAPWVSLWILGSAHAMRAQGRSDLLDTWREHLGERLENDLHRMASDLPVNPRVHPSSESLSRDDFVLSPAVSPNQEMRPLQAWLPSVAGILAAGGLSPKFLAVAAVESGFNTQALSPKGARGLWQLMPQTARRYGLVVNAWQDDRVDPVKSTFAAAGYLRDLYAQFGDWPLALAAYNAGEDRVQRALERLKARDFWELDVHAALPEETRQYVPEVLARMKSLRAFSDGPPFTPTGAANPARLNPAGPAPLPVVYATPSAAPVPTALGGD